MARTRNPDTVTKITVGTYATLPERNRWQKLAKRQNLTLSMWVKKALLRYEKELAPLEKPEAKAS